MNQLSVLGTMCRIEFNYYRNDTVMMTAVRLEDSEEWCVLTVNYCRYFEGPDYAKQFAFPFVVIKNGGENKGVFSDLVQANVIEPGAYLSGTGGTIQFGRLTPKWQRLARRHLNLPEE
jgi:hypothetical protein